MRQLTVRGVDDSLHAALSDAAKQRGTSVNQFVLDLLNGHLGLASSRQADSPSFADLDHLAGTWTKKEGEVFLAELGRQRKVDAGMWK
jgi:hypothetical protein